MENNKLIVAAAGSGKTTRLVEEALTQDENSNILITTFTRANEDEIKKKIIQKNKFIPENITVQTWFSFLIDHGAKPFQGAIYSKDITGMLLVNRQSGLKYKTRNSSPVYYKEATEFENHYFTPNRKIYSDKLSKFVVRCNEKSGGAVIERLSKIYSHIYIDEVQDLAGYDLEILKLLFSSPINTLLVGDPRQGTYSTNNSRKNHKYKKSKIIHFFEDDSISIETDNTSLMINYRCISPICDLSNKLFPDLPKTTSGNTQEIESSGITFVRSSDIQNYIERHNPSPMQLRWDKRTKVSREYYAMNFGESKGLTFERVLIYPPKNFIEWILDNNLEKIPHTSRSKYYVALTRAKFSVGLVFDYPEDISVDGILLYKPN